MFSLDKLPHPCASICNSFNHPHPAHAVSTAVFAVLLGFPLCAVVDLFVTPRPAMTHCPCTAATLLALHFIPLLSAGWCKTDVCRQSKNNKESTLLPPTG